MEDLLEGIQANVAQKNLINLWLLLPTVDNGRPRLCPQFDESGRAQLEFCLFAERFWTAVVFMHNKQRAQQLGVSLERRPELFDTDPDQEGYGREEVVTVTAVRRDPWLVIEHELGRLPPVNSKARLLIFDWLSHYCLGMTHFALRGDDDVLLLRYPVLVEQPADLVTHIDLLLMAMSVARLMFADVAGGPLRYQYHVECDVPPLFDMALTVADSDVRQVEAQIRQQIDPALAARDCRLYATASPPDDVFAPPPMSWKWTGHNAYYPGSVVTNLADVDPYFLGYAHGMAGCLTEEIDEQRRLGAPPTPASEELAQLARLLSTELASRPNFLVEQDGSFNYLHRGKLVHFIVEAPSEDSPGYRLCAVLHEVLPTRRVDMRSDFFESLLREFDTGALNGWMYRIVDKSCFLVLSHLHTPPVDRLPEFIERTAPAIAELIYALNRRMLCVPAVPSLRTLCFVQLVSLDFFNSTDAASSSDSSTSNQQTNNIEQSPSNQQTTNIEQSPNNQQTINIEQSPNNIEQSTTDGEQPVEELRNACVLCHQRESELVLPCGHWTCCETCGQAAGGCPVCAGTVDSVQEVLFKMRSLEALMASELSNVAEANEHVGFTLLAAASKHAVYQTYCQPLIERAMLQGSMLALGHLMGKLADQLTSPLHRYAVVRSASLLSSFPHLFTDESSVFNANSIGFFYDALIVQQMFGEGASIDMPTAFKLLCSRPRSSAIYDYALPQIYLTGIYSLPGTFIAEDAQLARSIAMESWHAGHHSEFEPFLFLGCAGDGSPRRDADVLRAVQNGLTSPMTVDSASIGLALCHLLGVGVPRDPVEAFRLLSEERDHQSRLLLLGYCYYHGVGVERDAAKGEALYRQYANSSDLLCYIRPLWPGLEPMAEHFADWAIANVSPPTLELSMVYLLKASLLFDPTGGELSAGAWSRALPLLEAAAQLQNPVAYFELAMCHLLGRGCGSNVSRAIELFRVEGRLRQEISLKDVHEAPLCFGRAPLTLDLRGRDLSVQQLEQLPFYTHFRRCHTIDLRDNPRLTAVPPCFRYLHAATLRHVYLDADCMLRDVHQQLARIAAHRPDLLVDFARQGGLAPEAARRMPTALVCLDNALLLPVERYLLVEGLRNRLNQLLGGEHDLVLSIGGKPVAVDDPRNIGQLYDSHADQHGLFTVGLSLAGAASSPSSTPSFARRYRHPLTFCVTAALLAALMQLLSRQRRS